MPGTRGDMSQKKRSRTMHVVFPFSDDIIAEVLIRLPTKALYKCKCVCKSWASLIAENNFLNNFIARSKSLPPLVTGVFYPKDMYESATGLEEMDTGFLDFGTLQSLVHTLPVDICLSFLRCSIFAVAAHNGFLLFAERPEKPTFINILYYRFTYIVCNPLTKQFVDLPKPHSNLRSYSTFLFCYNKKGSGDQHIEFKVVSLLHTRNSQQSKVDVYSSETGKWKLSSIFHDEPIWWDIAFMFNGCLYFPASRHLFAYDVMEETTGKVELPPDAKKPGCFGVSDGLLYYAYYCHSFFSVWVLVDGVRWDLVHKVEFASLDSYSFRPFCFHPLDHKIVLVKSSQGMALYHTGTRKLKFLDSFSPREYPLVIPYSLPAWLPCLPNTLRHAKPAANVTKRMNKCSKARVTVVE